MIPVSKPPIGKYEPFQVNNPLNIYAFLILLLGIILRLHNLGVAALWYDEAWRALIVSSDHWMESLKVILCPLPLLFILIPRMITDIFGNTEFCLRIMVALSGILALIFLYLIVIRLAGTIPAIIALFMMSLQPEFIYYSRIFKQYSFDILFTLILLYLTERFYDKDNNFSFKWAEYILFSFFILIGIYFSFILILIYPAIFLILLWSLRRKIKYFIAFIVLALISSMEYLMYYIKFLSFQRSDYLIEFWGKHFFRSSDGLMNNITGLCCGFLDVFKKYIFHYRNPIGIYVIDLTALLFLISFVTGIYWLSKKGNNRVSFYIFSSWALIALLAFLQIWPYSPARVNIFIYSIFFIPVSIGLKYVFFDSKYAHKNMTISMLALVFLGAMYLPVSRFNWFYGNDSPEDIRPDIKIMYNDLGRDDKVFIYEQTMYSFSYYSREYTPFKQYQHKLLNGDHFRKFDDSFNLVDFRSYLDKAKDKNMRIWVLCTYGDPPPIKLSEIKEILKKWGSLILSEEHNRSCMYLFARRK